MVDDAEPLWRRVNERGHQLRAESDGLRLRIAGLRYAAARYAALSRDPTTPEPLMGPLIELANTVLECAIYMSRMIDELREDGSADPP